MKRPPRPSLRPFVSELWAMARPVGGGPSAAACERMLPSGAMHIAIRLCQQPIRLLDPHAARSDDLGHAVVAGARAAHYLRDVAPAACTVGVQLRPGAAECLFGVPADALAGRHVRLDALCGAAADALRERLLDTPSPAARLDLLEAWLAARLPRVHGVHPAVAEALRDFDAGASVQAAVARSGYSHRRFIALFRRAVGLPPKLYARVRRFRGLIERLSAQPDLAWTELAIDAGYSDQSHFVREFHEFAGVTPQAYRNAAPTMPGHLPAISPAGSRGPDLRRRAL